ncbi:MAG: PD-(D/E)XK nuclease family protein [Muribaculaceae bacterium]|nr:PD-(D/E)XK nuclease family protein [Muribaculaceae bacterium]
MTYNDLNAHPRDSRLTFEPESHTYTVDGREFRSVTALVGDLFEKFDADYWAARKATPSHPAEVIKAEWEERAAEARNLGTLMHHRIEQYYLGADTEAWVSDPTFRHFCAFTWHHRLRPFRSEWPVFIEEYRLAGTVDFLADNGDGTLDLWDWKRSSKLVDRSGAVIDHNRYGVTALAPLEHVPDTSFHHYALQLGIYRYILESKYGVRIRSAKLGVFHPDHTTFHVVDLPYMYDEVKTILR